MPFLSPTAKGMAPAFFVEADHVYNNRFGAGILQLKYIAGKQMGTFYKMCLIPYHNKII